MLALNSATEPGSLSTSSLTAAPESSTTPIPLPLPLVLPLYFGHLRSEHRSRGDTQRSLYLSLLIDWFLGHLRPCRVHIVERQKDGKGALTSAWSVYGHLYPPEPRAGVGRLAHLSGNVSKQPQDCVLQLCGYKVRICLLAITALPLAVRRLIHWHYPLLASLVPVRCAQR
ncbi:MAG: hypothetical protein AVDCRST_MAG77-4952 [uncultured Chloroflexi bacterium]|uniref:Uncharacterized protein n=1 Tax=uncultured Chloroflexota bacterium TaxID=166587 RepID=A0A6J4K1T8_9CHLR|nr:MAG: hypothetical protein AVDCRST_MAG77-4952 [uncultured Chloroflexota bacterium]